MTVLENIDLVCLLGCLALGCRFFKSLNKEPQGLSFHLLHLSRALFKPEISCSGCSEPQGRKWLLVCAPLCPCAWNRGSFLEPLSSFVVPVPWLCSNGRRVLAGPLHTCSHAPDSGLKPVSASPSRPLTSDKDQHADARFLCPWDSPGKNTGLGCHFSPRGLPDPTRGLRTRTGDFPWEP